MAHGSIGRRGRRAAVVLLALPAACADDAAPPAAAATAPLPVALATVVPAAGVGSIAASGTVRLKREAALGFNTGGRIAAIAVDAGDTVARGQLLARLDPTGLGAASASARAEAVRADAELRRLRTLLAQGWVTRPRVEAAEAAAAAARAGVQQTGFDIRTARIVAPTAGVVLLRSAEPGQTVAAGAPVVTIGELSGGYVLRVPLADADLARVKLGQLASVTLPALSPQPIAATVSELGARGNAATGTFMVELALPVRPGLRSGLIGGARLRTGADDASGRVAVPASAVFNARADEGFVYVHDAAAGAVRVRLVGLGPLGDRDIVVTRGLRLGERVVASGVDRLRDGAKVTARP